MHSDVHAHVCRRDDRYIKMSSPNMNNVILMGAMLAFTSIVFGGMDSNVVDEATHLIMCKVID